MKTIIFFIANLIFSFWDNLMEEISKLEFSKEGIYLMSGIIGLVVIGIIVVSIKEKIDDKKEQEQPPTQIPHPHHHHHRRHHRK